MIVLTVRITWIAAPTALSLSDRRLNIEREVTARIFPALFHVRTAPREGCVATRGNRRSRDNASSTSRVHCNIPILAPPNHQCPTYSASSFWHRRRVVGLVVLPYESEKEFPRLLAFRRTRARKISKRIAFVLRISSGYDLARFSVSLSLLFIHQTLFQRLTPSFIVRRTLPELRSRTTLYYASRALF